MAFKVLLVDDEKLERVLIRKAFPWEEYDFEIVGEAGSGKEALEFMKHKRPDIVLADISMPQMSGLELAEQILNSYPDCHIVMITGYREFEYARQAVRLGVEDFLLKPINIEEVEKAAKKIKQKIQSEHKRKQEAMKERQNILAEQDILMESFFQRLVEKRISKEEALVKLNIYGLERLAAHCVCADIRVKEGAGDKKHAEILDDIKRMDWDSCVCFVHYLKNIVLFFMDEKESRAISCVTALLNNNSPKGVTVGVSRAKSGFSGIAEAYEEAGGLLEASVLFGQDRVLCYDDVQKPKQVKQAEPAVNWEEFSFFLSNVMRQQVMEAAESYLSAIRHMQKVDAEDLKLLLMNMLSKAGTTLAGYGTSLFQIVGEEELILGIKEVQNIEEGGKFLREKLEIILDFHEAKKMKKTNRTVAQAMEYISQNLCDPDLTVY